MIKLLFFNWRLVDIIVLLISRWSDIICCFSLILYFSGLILRIICSLIFLICALIILNIFIIFVCSLYSWLRMRCVYLFSFFVLFYFLQSFSFILSRCDFLFYKTLILFLGFLVRLFVLPVESSLCFWLILWRGFSVSTKNIYIKF